MQGSTEGISTNEIQLTSMAEDYQMLGFSALYAEHLQTSIEGAIYFRILSFVGLAITVVGILTIMFGPSTITYSILTGPTFTQFVQMYPGPIATVGGFVYVIGNALYAKRSLPPEVLVRSLFRFVGLDGEDVTESVNIHYLGGDDFNFSLPPVAPPAPGSH